nr:MAG TPA: hypothetical protein [Bacteriophage sp.]
MLNDINCCLIVVIFFYVGVVNYGRLYINNNNY